MPAGSYFPDQSQSMYYAMAGDDCSLHFDLANLTPKQQADHQSNIELTAMLQVALLSIGKHDDHVALYKEFQAAPWQETLAFYRNVFERLDLDPIPVQHCHYHPAQSLYASVAASTVTTDLINLYMVSGSNQVLHGSDDALRVSQAVNSKMHFATHAPDFGIPVPATLLTTKAELESAEVTHFLETQGTPCMLKTLGLAGARNVTTINNSAEALSYVAEYPADMPVLLQRKLRSGFTEMTVDLFVSDSEIRIANVRQILFSDGLWVGNLIGANVAITPEHEAELLRVGEYAREQGYTSPEGFNCGIDYFVSDQELLVTEINARWTGGLFPAELVRRLDIGHRTVVAFFDLVRRDRIGDYLAFSDRHLLGATAAPFACVPIGFSPFPTEIDGVEYIYLWQMVVDDFGAFKAAKEAELGAGMLPTADNISLAL